METEVDMNVHTSLEMRSNELETSKRKLRGK